ncbi:phage associated protein [Spirochaetia bacterium]|nr:phage associated protein [Spirochaetia bacterium]
MYRSWVERMAAADSAAERKSVADDMCRVFGFSQKRTYRELKAAGWESGRAKRKDAGITGVDDTLLLSVAEMIKLGIRKNGKATLPVNVARSILESRGAHIPVSDGRIRTLLRERHLSIADSRIATPHQPMRTEYPNQVHFADPSVSLLYYEPGGRQKIIGDDELYKNKNFLENKDKCWRYVLTDHYSASICVRYYAAPGESAANMYDFLLYAWGQKQTGTFVFHGLPELLIWDCGTANIAKATTNALKAFNVKTLPHLPGNPRAKGQVENANNLVETQFESRLRFEPVHSIGELNAAAEKWCAAYNANLIDGLETSLRRAGANLGSRAFLWQRIRKNELRELPDEQTCRQVFANGIQTRKVAGDLSVGIAHPKAGRSLRYSLRDLQGILVGMRVSLQPVLVSDEPTCIVSYRHEGAEVSFEIEPIQYDEAGFDLDAPVFGANYKRPKDTAREKQAKVLDNPALVHVMGPAHSFINPGSPFVKTQSGEVIEVAETVHTHEILISATEMAKRIKPILGFVPDGFINRLKKEYPQGVPARLLDDFVKQPDEQLRKAM